MRGDIGRGLSSFRLHKIRLRTRWPGPIYLASSSGNWVERAEFEDSKPETQSAKLVTVSG